MNFTSKPCEEICIPRYRRFLVPSLGVLAAVCLPLFAAATEPNAGLGGLNNVITTTLPPADSEARAEAVAQAVPRLQEVLAEVWNRVGALKVSPELRQQLQAECDTLRTRLEALEQRITALGQAANATTSAPSETADQLRSKLRQLEKQRDALLHRLAELEETPDLPVPEFSHKRPHYVAVIKNRIMPVDEPYFKDEAVDTIRGQVVRSTRLRDGEEVAKAFAPGGCMDVLLSKLDKENHSIGLLVSSDSIDAFLQAVPELQRRGFWYRWHAHNDEPIFFGAGGSGGSDVPPPQR